MEIGKELNELLAKRNEKLAGIKKLWLEIKPISERISFLQDEINRDRYDYESCVEQALREKIIGFLNKGWEKTKIMETLLITPLQYDLRIRRIEREKQRG